MEQEQNKENIENKEIRKETKLAALYEALAKFQGECPEIDLDGNVEIKTKSGATIKFKYATLGNIINKVRKPLSKNGLSFVFKVTDSGAECILLHKDGGMISSGFLTLGRGAEVKQIGANLTYAKRYTLTSLLGIQAEEDKDENGTGGSAGNGKKKLSTKGFDDAVERIIDGETIVALQVALHFELSEEQSQQLIELTATKLSGNPKKKENE